MRDWHSLLPRGKATPSPPAPPPSASGGASSSLSLTKMRRPRDRTRPLPHAPPASASGGASLSLSLTRVRRGPGRDAARPTVAPAAGLKTSFSFFLRRPPPCKAPGANDGSAISKSSWCARRLRYAGLAPARAWYASAGVVRQLRVACAERPQIPHLRLQPRTRRVHRLQGRRWHLAAMAANSAD